eukprot:COSAG04_NODE_3503_length_2764_cov_15.932458_5_plen_90_part_00
MCALNSASLRKTEYRSSTRRKVVASILPLRALSYSASASRSCTTKQASSAQHGERAVVKRQMGTRLSAQSRLGLIVLVFLEPFLFRNSI